MTQDTITINNVEYIKKDSTLFKQKLKVKSVEVNHLYEVGDFYFIQTPTLYYCGILSAITDGELMLTDAAWIPDTGRFNEFCKGAKPKELEPCGDAPVLISRGAVIAALKRPPIILEVI